MELGPQVGAGSAGEEAVVDTKKNWSAGGLFERERLLEECGSSLQPTREAMERLALLETVWMKESNAGPKVLAMSDAGRGWSEAFAVRAALLKRAGRGAGSMVESVGEGSVGEGAEVGSCKGRDGRTESRKEGKGPREAEPPGTRSLPRALLNSVRWHGWMKTDSHLRNIRGTLDVCRAGKWRLVDGILANLLHGRSSELKS